MKELDFAIGARIHCKDGRAGVLRKVVVDPHSRRVIDLVAEKGLLQKKDRVLPISIVVKASAEDIYLTIQSTELPNYPEYRETDFAVPASGWEITSPFRRDEIRHWTNRYGVEGFGSPVIPMVRKHQVQGIASNLEAIGRNTPIRNHEGVVGKVDHLLVVRDTQEVTHFVTQNGILRHQLVIPVEWVEDIDDDGIYIRGRRADLKELSRYTPRPPADMLSEVRTELRKAPFDFRDIVTSLELGVLRLSGVVKNAEEKRRAEALAGSVAGVIAIDNRLDTSTAIDARIIAALESDPRTHLSVIDVVNEHGVVTLSGEVSSAKIRSAAEELAVRQHGVMAVINELEVKPSSRRGKEVESIETLSFTALEQVH